MSMSVRSARSASPLFSPAAVKNHLSYAFQIKAVREIEAEILQICNFPPLSTTLFYEWFDLTAGDEKEAKEQKLHLDTAEIDAQLIFSEYKNGDDKEDLAVQEKMAWQVIPLIISALMYEIKKCTRKHIEILENAKQAEEEKKPCSVHKNNELLIQYLQDLQAIFKRIRYDFSKIIDRYCMDKMIYFNKAVDINVYQIAVTKTEYDSLMKDVRRFHYQGGPKTFKNVLSGMGQSFFGLIGMGSFPAKDIVEVVRQYGFACWQDIPARYIIKQLKSPEELAENGHAGKTLFVVDAQDPLVFMQEGTCYSLGKPSQQNPHPVNPKGHTVFFHRLQDAWGFAEHYKNGHRFHPQRGWRLNHDWKAEETVFLDQPSVELSDDAKGVELTAIFKLSADPG